MSAVKKKLGKALKKRKMSKGKASGQYKRKYSTLGGKSSDPKFVRYGKKIKSGPHKGRYRLKRKASK
mgnify:CR=1 FL=1